MAPVKSVTSMFPGSWAKTKPSILSPADSTATWGVTPQACFLAFIRTKAE